MFPLTFWCHFGVTLFLTTTAKSPPYPPPPPQQAPPLPAAPRPSRAREIREHAEPVAFFGGHGFELQRCAELFAQLLRTLYRASESAEVAANAAGAMPSDDLGPCAWRWRSLFFFQWRFSGGGFVSAQQKGRPTSWGVKQP